MIHHQLCIDLSKPLPENVAEFDIKKKKEEVNPLSKIFMEQKLSTHSYAEQPNSKLREPKLF